MSWMNSEGKWRVNSNSQLKTNWTWEEWRQSRAARRAVSERICPGIIRRKASSSDFKLRNAFQGQRGPNFTREQTPDKDGSASRPD